LYIAVETTILQTSTGVIADHGQSVTAHLPSTAKSQGKTGESLPS